MNKRDKARTVPKREITEERLLEEAAHLFRERGYLATSVRDIALAANMKSGSIYYHFPSKEAILEAVMNRALLSLIEAVSSALNEVGPEASFNVRLKAAILAHLSTVHLYGDFAIASRQSLGQLSEARRASHMRLRSRYGSIWRGLFEAARGRGELREDVDIVPVEMLLIGAMNWTHEWLDPKRRSLETLSDVFAATIARSIMHRADTDADGVMPRASERSSVR